MDADTKLFYFIRTKLNISIIAREYGLRIKKNDRPFRDYTIEINYISTFIKKLYSIYKFCKSKPDWHNITIFNRLQAQEKLSYKWVKSDSFLENIFHRNQICFYVDYDYEFGKKTYLTYIFLNDKVIATIYLHNIPIVIHALKTIYANHS